MNSPSPETTGVLGAFVDPVKPVYDQQDHLLNAKATISCPYR